MNISLECPHPFSFFQQEVKNGKEQSYASTGIKNTIQNSNDFRIGFVVLMLQAQQKKVAPEI
jgi:hypothetical protein